ncbi:MAG: TatD family hydrolase [Duodenibacillus sp.]|nr:TatD family hydrolase [Duodenibacillus sp.]
MRFFDTHCHYADARFDANREVLLDRARAAGLTDALICTTKASDYEKAKTLARTQRFKYALGLFDLAADFTREPEAGVEILARALEESAKDGAEGFAPAAVGEVGVDRNHIEAGREKESLFVLDAAAGLALTYNLPLSIHARGALALVAGVLKKRRNSALRGVIHAFNGSAEEARVFVKLGFKPGFGSVLLNPGARRIARVFSELAPTDFVLETDAPFMVPFDRRSEPNARTEPVEIARILEAAARIRGETPETTAEAAFANARTVFG